MRQNNDQVRVGSLPNDLDNDVCRVKVLAKDQGVRVGAPVWNNDPKLITFRSRITFEAVSS